MKLVGGEPTWWALGSKEVGFLVSRSVIFRESACPADIALSAVAEEPHRSQASWRCRIVDVTADSTIPELGMLNKAM